MKAINAIFGDVVDQAIKIHIALGPGLLLNFSLATRLEGIDRVVNSYQPSS